MPQTVLFVDDNPVILKTIELAFAKKEYGVLLASSRSTWRSRFFRSVPARAWANNSSSGIEVHRK